MIDLIMFYYNSIIVLSSLPLKFYSLRILCFSDWQGNLSADFLLSILEKIERPDFLIFAGDGMLRFLSEEYLNRFPEGIRPYTTRFISNKEVIEHLVNYPKMAFIYVEGNDDPEIDLSFLGAIRLSGKIFKCKLNFLGLEGSPGPIGGITYRSEGYYEDILRKAVNEGEKFVLVSHTPPYGILDRIPRGIRVGSRVLREFLDTSGERFPLVISGHAHNWGGKWVKFGESIVINCAMSVMEVKMRDWKVEDIQVVF
jgi:Icc-related predicted phosphoesterase